MTLGGTRPAAADLLAALPVAVLLVDDAGLIADANAAGEALLNRSARALRGCPLSTIVPDSLCRPDDFAAFDAEIATGVTRVRADVAEAELPTAPGWRVVALHPVRARHLGGGGTRAAMGAVAMLAHEIRNPLSGIRGAAQLLGPGELTQIIIDEVDRVAALIDRMQDFTDTRPLPLAAENIYPLLARVRQVAEAGFARGVGVEEAFDPSLPPALVARDALVQVLLNLVKNAAEATAHQADRRIVLSTAYRHGITALPDTPGGARRPLPIEIAVADNGPGVPADIADHLFEPFVSGRPEGRGLGLALVSKLVRDMGGIVRHAREGDQTVFRLLLPRAA